MSYEIFATLFERHKDLSEENLKIRRQTQITILTEKILTLAGSDVHIALFAKCAVCAMQMLSVDEAAKFARVNSLTIYRLVEAGQLHFEETQEGFLLVCSASLSAIDSENLENKI